MLRFGEEIANDLDHALRLLDRGKVAGARDELAKTYSRVNEFVVALKR
jgi:hypothetical protein